ncbi:uncharacterized protein LOC121868182 [Homarus americanus]|uniref:uncharacterized protein LOC121868182 n=1 Tax=Homarus americanus TaxID=6706 RepID=UPI001C48ED2A|nr:uncharacterized protein LOC121868182 [Homarus americanus]
MTINNRHLRTDPSISIYGFCSNRDPHQPLRHLQGGQSPNLCINRTSPINLCSICKSRSPSTLQHHRQYATSQHLQEPVPSHLCSIQNQSIASTSQNRSHPPQQHLRKPSPSPASTNGPSTSCSITKPVHQPHGTARPVHQPLKHLQDSPFHTLRILQNRSTNLSSINKTIPSTPQHLEPHLQNRSHPASAHLEPVPPASRHLQNQSPSTSASSPEPVPSNHSPSLQNQSHNLCSIHKPVHHPLPRIYRTVHQPLQHLPRPVPSTPPATSTEPVPNHCGICKTSPIEPLRHLPGTGPANLCSILQDRSINLCNVSEPVVSLCGICRAGPIATTAASQSSHISLFRHLPEPVINHCGIYRNSPHQPLRHLQNRSHRICGICRRPSLYKQHLPEPVHRLCSISGSISTRHLQNQSRSTSPASTEPVPSNCGIYRTGPINLSAASAEPASAEPVHPTSAASADQSINLCGILQNRSINLCNIEPVINLCSIYENQSISLCGICRTSPSTLSGICSICTNPSPSTLTHLQEPVPSPRGIYQSQSIGSLRHLPKIRPSNSSGIYRTVHQPLKHLQRPIPNLCGISETVHQPLRIYRTSPSPSAASIRTGPIASAASTEPVHLTSSGISTGCHRLSASAEQSTINLGSISRTVPSTSQHLQNRSINLCGIYHRTTVHQPLQHLQNQTPSTLRHLQAVPSASLPQHLQEPVPSTSAASPVPSRPLRIYEPVPSTSAASEPVRSTSAASQNRSHLLSAASTSRYQHSCTHLHAGPVPRFCALQNQSINLCICRPVHQPLQHLQNRSINHCSISRTSPSNTLRHLQNQSHHLCSICRTGPINLRTSARNRSHQPLRHLQNRSHRHLYQHLQNQSIACSIPPEPVPQPLQHLQEPVHNLCSISEPVLSLLHLQNQSICSISETSPARPLHHLQNRSASSSLSAASLEPVPQPLQSARTGPINFCSILQNQSHPPLQHPEASPSTSAASAEPIHQPLQHHHRTRSHQPPAASCRTVTSLLRHLQNHPINPSICRTGHPSAASCRNRSHQPLQHLRTSPINLSAASTRTGPINLCASQNQSSTSAASQNQSISLQHLQNQSINLCGICRTSPTRSCSIYRTSPSPLRHQGQPINLCSIYREPVHPTSAASAEPVLNLCSIYRTGPISLLRHLQNRSSTSAASAEPVRNLCSISARTGPINFCSISEPVHPSAHPAEPVPSNLTASTEPVHQLLRHLQNRSPSTCGIYRTGPHQPLRSIYEPVPSASAASGRSIDTLRHLQNRSHLNFLRHLQTGPINIAGICRTGHINTPSSENRSHQPLRICGTSPSTSCSIYRTSPVTSPAASTEPVPSASPSANRTTNLRQHLPEPVHQPLQHHRTVPSQPLRHLQEPGRINPTASADQIPPTSASAEPVTSYSAIYPEPVHQPHLHLWNSPTNLCSITRTGPSTLRIQTSPHQRPPALYRKSPSTLCGIYRTGPQPLLHLQPVHQPPSIYRTSPTTPHPGTGPINTLPHLQNQPIASAASHKTSHINLYSICKNQSINLYSIYKPAQPLQQTSCKTSPSTSANQSIASAASLQSSPSTSAASTAEPVPSTSAASAEPIINASTASTYRTSPHQPLQHPQNGPISTLQASGTGPINLYHSIWNFGPINLYSIYKNQVHQPSAASAEPVPSATSTRLQNQSPSASRQHLQKQLPLNSPASS